MASRYESRVQAGTQTLDVQGALEGFLKLGEEPVKPGAGSPTEAPTEATSEPKKGALGTVAGIAGSVAKGALEIVTSPVQTGRSVLAGTVDIAAESARLGEELASWGLTKVAPGGSEGRFLKQPGERFLSDYLKDIADGIAPQNASGAQHFVRETARMIEYTLSGAKAAKALGVGTGVGIAAGGAASGFQRENPEESARVLTSYIGALSPDAQRVINDYIAGGVADDELEKNLKARFFNGAVELIGNAAGDALFAGLVRGVKWLRGAKGRADLPAVSTPDVPEGSLFDDALPAQTAPDAPPVQATGQTQGQLLDTTPSVRPQDAPSLPPQQQRLPLSTPETEQLVLDLTTPQKGQLGLFTNKPLRQAVTPEQAPLVQETIRKELETQRPVVRPSAPEGGAAPSAPVKLPAVFQTANARTYRPIVQEAARAEGVQNVALFESLIARESAFNPKAVSGAQAKGLGQLMDGTAREVGVTDSFDPAQNAKGAARYFARLEKRYHGSPEHIVAAYNTGPGRVAVGESVAAIVRKTDPGHVEAVMANYRALAGGARPRAVISTAGTGGSAARHAVVQQTEDGAYIFKALAPGDEIPAGRTLVREAVDGPAFDRLIGEGAEEAQQTFIEQSILAKLRQEAKPLMKALRETDDPALITPEVTRAATAASKDASLVRILGSERGAAQAGAVAGIVRSGLGAVVGGFFGDTPEEKIEYALLGAAAAGLTPGLARMVARRLALHVDDAVEAGVKQADTVAQKATREAVTKTATGPDSLPVKFGQETVYLNPKAELTADVINAGFKKLDKALELPKTRESIAAMKRKINEAGFTQADLLTDPEEIARLSARLNATSEAQAQVLKQILKKADDFMSSPTAEGMDDFLSEMNKHRVLYEAFRQVGSMEGRALRYRQSLSGLVDVIETIGDVTKAVEVGISPQDLARRMLGATDETMRHLHHNLDAEPSIVKALGAAQQAWLQAKGTAGMVKNTTANAAAIGVSVLEKYGKAGHQWVEKALLGASRDPEFAAAHQYLWATMDAFQDVFRRAGQVWRESADNFSAVAKNEGMRMSDFRAEAFRLDPSNPLGAGINWLADHVVNIIPRVNYTVDELAQGILSAGETRYKAVQASLEAGITDPGKQAAFIKAYMAKPPADAIRGIAEHAEHYTFNTSLYDQGGSFQALRDLAKKAGEMREAHPWMKIAMPFISTPANVGIFVGERFPGLNLLSANYRRALTSTDDVARSTAWAKMYTGMAALTAGIGLYTSGAMTGSGPRDKELRSLWMTDNQPNSLRLGGKQVGLNALDPMHQILSAGAVIGEAMSNGVSMEALEGLTMGLTLQVGEWLDSAPALATFGNLFDGAERFSQAMKQDDRQEGKDLERFALAFAKGIAAFNPLQGGPTGALVAVTDGQRREVRSVLDTITALIPGVSTTLPGKYNALGQPVYYGGMTDESAMNSAVNLVFPLRLKEEGQSPAVKLLVENKIDLAVLKPSISLGGVTVPFEGKEIDKYNAILRGEGALPSLGSVLEDFMADEGFKLLPEGEIREAAVKGIVRQFAEAARRAVMAEHTVDVLDRRDKRAKGIGLPTFSVGQ